MFKFKHEIELANKDKIWLFGEDYYNDKKVFWEAHCLALSDLCVKISEIGFPFKIIDLQTHKTLSVISKNQWDTWLKNHQPYHSD